MPTNADIAGMLDRIAALLEAKEENAFRVRSYRNAAASIRSTRRRVVQILRSKGSEGLTDIKGVGEKLAGLIQEYVEKGTVDLLQTLEKEVPDDKIEVVSGHDLRKPIELPVKIILEVDDEYRKKAAGDKLKKIAPRLLNPEKKAWLPILVTERKGHRFTVMFSNTRRAHELGKTNDWVVVYYEKGEGEDQCTVVTETRGALKGKRVIRGREKECERHYRL